MRSAKLV